MAENINGHGNGYQCASHHSFVRCWWVVVVVVVAVLDWGCYDPRCWAKYQQADAPYQQQQHHHYPSPSKQGHTADEPVVCSKTLKIDGMDMDKQDSSRFRNCTIVEGSVQIIRIKFKSEKDSAHWSFPNLVEITDFLLVYRVEGLSSLARLFPKLAVIRGMKLLERYSLVIYETFIEVIGLHNLRAIVRGSIKIKNNINLCYVHTVNWSSIVQGHDDSVLMDSSESLCKKCCPACSFTGKEKTPCQHCWDGTKCQQVCSPACVHGCVGGEGRGHQCCHEQCLGGCTWPNDASACVACRKFNYRGECYETCPETLLEYKDYRCVSSSYCKKKAKYYQFNNKLCVSDCPEGYQKGSDKQCVECKDVCPKECPGHLVNTVARAQELRGCTVITGSLIISIRYGKTVTKELEENLGKIERVRHHIRIFKTSPLKSFNFLSNLKIIDGEQLYSNRFALYVHDNANLEDIWDFNNHPQLEIRKGEIYFIGNPKLCYHSKIEKLLNMTHKEGDHNMKVTNGYRVACTMITHSITLEPYSFAIVVSWKPVTTNEDDRKITGYFIYYKETNDTNLGLMDGRDACNDEWKREHVEVKDSNKRLDVTLTGLMPYHTYAVCVETDTVADADVGARSNITIINTKPYNPSSPVNLRVVDKGTTYLAVAWDPPKNPHGNINDYSIYLSTLSYAEEKCPENCVADQLHLEEYYAEPEKDRHESEVSKMNSSPTLNTEASECCACPPKQMPPVEDDEILFGNSLNNYLFVHRYSRRKRNVGPDDSGASSKKTSYTRWEAQYRRYKGEHRTADEGVWRSRTRFFNFTNLSHYTQYKIEVSACHMSQVEDCPSGANHCEVCSIMPTRLVETTTMKAGANVVKNLSVKQINESVVQVAWTPPDSPNGQILAYQVLFRSEQKDFEGCVSACNLNDSQVKYYFINLTKLEHIAEYQVEVRTHTRAPKIANDTFATTNFTVKYSVRHSKDPGWSVIFLVIILLLGAVSVVIVFRRPSKLPAKDISDNPSSTPLTNPSSSIISSKYHIPEGDLRIGPKIGSGNFGVVFEGEWQQSKWIPVAVKQTSSLHSGEDMLLEAKLMLELECCHIVRAYGVSFGPKHTYLVMEYMSMGDLCKYLRRQETNLTIEQVCEMALQIADGMAYLANKKYVHRDLAARNCLINEDKKIKISDFGMTRKTEENYYHIRTPKDLPVRWLAPECFTEQRFTSQSDVWSYGVVLWEILTLGQKPYSEVNTLDRLQNMVIHGHTLKNSVKSLTEQWLADLICSCWQAERSARPSFLRIISVLLPHAPPLFLQLFRNVSFYHQS